VPVKILLLLFNPIHRNYLQ